MDIKTVQIDLNIKPSKDFGAKLVISLFDYLLHSRSQIPFHFDLFKKFVESKADQSSDESTRNKDWKTEKQLKLALDTFDNICAVKQIIKLEFNGGVPLMMIIFGSTVHTAKECFQITFPSVNESSLPTLFNETSTLNMILLKIVESDELKQSGKHQLPPTNVFVLFRKSQPRHIEEHQHLRELKNFKLIKSCRKFQIHFRDSSDFSIFEEGFEELSLSESSPADEEEAEDDTWYQSKTHVKGFKDILVNSKSIWT